MPFIYLFLILSFKFESLYLPGISCSHAQILFQSQSYEVVEVRPAQDD